MNGPDYDRVLRRRGELTIWFTSSLAKTWIAPPNGWPGGQRKYPDGGIEFARRWCMNRSTYGIRLFEMLVTHRGVQKLARRERSSG